MKKAIYTSPSISFTVIANTSVIAISGLRASATDDSIQTAIDTKGMLGFSGN